ncbi:MAG TPA: 30S ribosomal protein S8 [Patescibacteria group bacterium]|nr:30S ribosomal protein S8 [Patescibacteria group bacterium]
MTYHVADFIIRIQNAALARRKEVRMPYSKLSRAIAQVLVKEGFLAGVKDEEIEGKKQLVAEIRFVNRRPAVDGVKVISKPSLRVYKTKKSLNERLNPSVVSILSTSNGVMSGKTATKKGLGGELLFQIW